jgi:hypothetical protein
MNRLVDRVLGAGAPEDALYMTTIKPDRSTIGDGDAVHLTLGLPNPVTGFQ